jgi:hypothetical protein
MPGGHPEGPRLGVPSKPALWVWQPDRTAPNTADCRAGARAASNAGLWQEHSPGCGTRMARTESIRNLITIACYEPMTMCYKDLFNLLSRDAHTNYAYSMQNMQ